MLRELAVALPQVGYGMDRPCNGDGDEAGFGLGRALGESAKQLHQQQGDQPSAARDRHPAKRQTVAWLVAMLDKVKDHGRYDRSADQIAEDALAAPRRERAIAHRVPCQFPCPVGGDLITSAHRRAHGTERSNAQRPDLAILRPLVEDKCAHAENRQANDRVPEETGFERWLVHCLKSAKRALPEEA